MVGMAVISVKVNENVHNVMAQLFTWFGLCYMSLLTALTQLIHESTSMVLWRAVCCGIVALCAMLTPILIHVEATRVRLQKHNKRYETPRTQSVATSHAPSRHISSRVCILP
jgi:hypothetical protein